MDENNLTKNCSTCGAVIKLSPEDMVITCPYCGETYDVDFQKVPGHKMIPTKGSEEIKANVIKFLDKYHTNSDNASIVEVKANYLPYWIVPFNSHTHYYGVEQGSVTRYRTKTRTVKDAEGNTHTETYQEAYTVTVWRPKEGDFDRQGKENVIARKHTAFYGFNEFQSVLYLDNVEDFDFEKIKKSDSDIINAEVKGSEAQMETYGRVENQNRSMAASGLHKLVRCDSDIRVQKELYVHAPLWQVRYNFDEKLYKVSIAGDSGKVIKGELPLTLKRRIINYAIGMALLIIFSIVGNIGINMAQSDPNNEVLGIIMAIISVIAIGCSIIPFKNAFSIQLERSPIKDIQKERNKNLKNAKKALNKKIGGKK